MSKAKTKADIRKTKISTVKAASQEFDIKLNFGKFENWIYLGVILIAVLFFFKEGVFSGKVFASGDNIASESFKTFLDDAKAKNIFPLWVPYIFMGMPNLAALITYLPRSYDFFFFIWNSVYGFFTGGSDSTVMPIVIFYFVFGISFYFYIKSKFGNRLMGLYSAIAAIFVTPIIQLIIVGHNTKMMTLMFFPLILLLIEKIIDSGKEDKFKTLVNFALLAIVLHIQLNSNHIQMLFYSYLMIGIYLLYILIYRLIKKERYSGIIKAGVLFLAAAGISIAMNSDILLSVKEYNKYSMRGTPSIITQQDPSKKDAQPLDYDYATNWSFSPGEVLTFFMPYYYGFGDVEVQGQRTNLYWGQMPFTTSPVYFGVITLLLGIIGIIFNWKRNPYVQSLVVTIILFLLLSFGRTFPVIFDVFFYHFPFFSSFRAPVMILYLVDISFVILACYGIRSIIEARKDNETIQSFKKVRYVLFGIIGILFLFSLIGFESSYTSSVANGPIIEKLKGQGASAQQISQYTKQIASIAYSNVLSDIRLHSILMALSLGIAFLYVNRKISVNVMIILILMLTVFDLWNVNFKTLHWDNKSEKENTFSEPDYVSWILKNAPNTAEYRVAEFNKGNLITTNIYAYYRLQSFNGYQGAKLRIYQDAIDVAGDDNPELLGLANVKYIITDSPIQDSAFVQVFKGTSKAVYENRMFLPRAFFADEYKVDAPFNILNNIKLKNFDPKKTAFLEKDINKKADKPDSTVFARLTDWDIHHYSYDVKASGNNLLVLSEIYYPAGWKIYIDGTETEFYKTDYLLRSLMIPQGQHKLEMKFVPETYFAGKTISIASNILLGIMLIGGIAGVYIKKRRKDGKEEVI